MVGYRSVGVVDFEIPSPWMGRFFFSTLLATFYVGGFMIWAIRSGSLRAIMAAKHKISRRFKRDTRQYSGGLLEKRIADTTCGSKLDFCDSPSLSTVDDATYFSFTSRIASIFPYYFWWLTLCLSFLSTTNKPVHRLSVHGPKPTSLVEYAM